MAGGTVTIPGDGDPVGSVDVPDGLDGDLTIVRGSGPTRVGDIEIISPVIDIELVRDGQQVTDLGDSLRICLSADRPTDDSCLGFYDVERMEWRCQDRCLQEENGLLCGETDHLTSFALLLGAGTSDCGSNEMDMTLFWLSVALLIAAGVLILISMVLVEVRIHVLRSKRARLNNRLTVVIE